MQFQDFPTRVYVDEPLCIELVFGSSGNGNTGVTGPETPGADAFDRAMAGALGLDPVPVTLHPGSLQDHRPDFWKRWYLADRAERSQYDRLREVASEHGGVPGPTVCLALRGRGFHGQHGRRWRTLAGNLHLSLAIPCDLDARTVGPILPALAVVGVCEAIEKLSLDKTAPGIKWVNDILVSGRKVAGMLTSLRSRNGRVEVIFIGVGVNVLSAPDPDETDPELDATCLAAQTDTGTVSLATVLASVLEAVSARYRDLQADGPVSLLEAYRARSVIVGKTAVVRPDSTASPADPVVGRVTGISDDLGLIIDGHADPLHSGRLESMD